MTVPITQPQVPGRTVRAVRVVLTLGLLAVVLAALPWDTFDLDRHAAPKELALHLTAVLVLVTGRRWLRTLPVTPLDLGLAVFIGVSAISGLFAVNWWLAFRAVAMGISAMVIFEGARLAARDDGPAPLVAAVAAATVLGASTGLLQAYGVWTGLAAEVRAPGGTLGNRNFMAHLSVLGLPAVWYTGCLARKPGRLLLAMTGVTVLAGALLLSRSRGAWLGLVASTAAAGALLLVARHKLPTGLIRRRTLQLGSAAAIGVGAAAVLPNTLEWKSPSPYLDSLRDVANYREGSGRGRLIQYRNTLPMSVSHPPVGVGPGNWAVEYPRYTGPGDPSYNAGLVSPTNPWPSSDWMAVVSERGPAGTLALAWVGLAFMLAIRRGLRRPLAESRGVGLVALCMTSAALAVMGTFDAVLLQPAPLMFTAVLAGALLPAGDPPGAALSDRAWRRLAAVGLLVCCLAAMRSGTQVLGMSLYEQAGSARWVWAPRVDPGSYKLRMLLAEGWRRRGRCGDAIREARAAAELFPNNPAPAEVLRKCGVR